MHLPHGGTEFCRVLLGIKSLHGAVGHSPTRRPAMFVRAVWRHRRLVDIKRGGRGSEAPTIRDALGLASPDFQKLTRGLFDR